MSAARVVLWRHGRTAYNHGHRFQGQLDIPLDDVGVTQAEAAGALLAARLSGAGPVRLITSDLSRAWMTADALARRLSVVAERDPALREIFSGAWEGLSRDEIDARWPDDWAAWRRGEDVRIGGGPTVVREYLKAGLVDQLHVAIVPILLGRGIRLWDGLRGLESGYAVKEETAPSGTIHLTFRR